MVASRVAVHRCRFVDHVPHSIEWVDFEPSGERLAVLRANADIEIWCLARGGWFCESRLAGATDSPVRRVAWAAYDPAFPQGRLFSSGLHGMITEWDLCTLCPKASCDSYGGAIWAMSLHHGTGLLAVGCEDGGVSLMNTKGDELTLKARLPSLNARVLSVAFNPQGSHIACGTAGGVVCVWHIPSRSVTSQATLEAHGLERRRKPPLVWSVLLLADMAVVAGDSSGHVTFIDGRHGTLVQSFGSHAADVLALAASRDGSAVFASGVDHKLALFSPQPEPPPAPTLAGAAFALPAPPRRWMLACSRRPHTHDVRTLAVGAPRAAEGAALLVSAGIDAQLSALPLADFERARPTKLLPFPQRGAYALAPARRLLLCQEPQSLQLWQLPAYTPGVVPAALEGRSSTDGGEAADEPRQLLHLKPKLAHANLRCSALSPDCEWIACSDSETRLYKLTLAPDAGATASRVLVRRVPLPPDVPPATCVAFSVDSRLLLLGAVSGVVVAVQLGAIDGPDADAEPELPVHVLRTPQIEGASGVAHRAALLHFALSADGQWLATADAARHVRIYSLDSFNLATTVPPLASPPTALAFSPRSDLLAIASANKQLTLFDVDRGCLSPWSARNPGPLAAIGARRETVDRIAFNPALVLCAQSWLCHVSLSEAPAPAAEAAPTPAASSAPQAAEAPASAPERFGQQQQQRRKRSGAGSKKRKAERSGRGQRKEARPEPAATPTAVVAASRGGAAGGAAGEAGAERVVTRYGPMLLFDFLAADTALVLERPWLRVMEHFPPTLHRPRFGT